MKTSTKSLSFEALTDYQHRSGCHNGFLTALIHDSVNSRTHSSPKVQYVVIAQALSPIPGGAPKPGGGADPGPGLGLGPPGGPFAAPGIGGSPF